MHTLARELGLYPGTVYTWLRTGRVRSTQHGRAAPHWLDLDAPTLDALRDHVARERTRTHARPGPPRTASQTGAA